MFKLAVAVLFFLFNFFSGIDYGAFSPDYYQAHLLTMIHLHKPNVNFFDLMRTIPNSASGVFPLWLYGFINGIYAHKFASLFVYLSIIAIVIKYSSLNSFGLMYLVSLSISPMIISATTWVLPELFALFLLICILMLGKNYPKLSVILSFFLPLSRQTSIVLLFGRIFFKPANLYVYIATVLSAAIGLGCLIYIWQGLVPPNLAKVHMTSSIKSAIIALLIFSLFFLYANVRAIGLDKIKFRKLSLCILFSVLIVLIGLNQSNLYGGGYVFSRVESFNIVFAFILEVSLLAILFYSSSKPLILFCLFASISFATTNYMFLKYIDFYIFGFLGYYFTDIDENNKIKYLSYVKSVLIFEIFSIITAFLFYIVK